VLAELHAEKTQILTELVLKGLGPYAVPFFFLHFKLPYSTHAVSLSSVGPKCEGRAVEVVMFCFRDLRAAADSQNFVAEASCAEL